MSHIIKSDEDIVTMSKNIDILRTKEYSKDIIYQMLLQIIPTNEKYQVVPEVNSTGYTAYFSGYEKKIHVNYEAVKKYVEEAIKWIVEQYPSLENQKNDIFAYMTFFVLSHEVEHVYQHLIGEEFIDNPYLLVKQAYKNISNYCFKDNMNGIWIDILIERYKRQKDRATFVLERNANVEVYEMLSRIATYENNPNLHLFLNNQYLWYSVCGYLKMRNNGPFEESYRNIWRHRQYKSFDFTEDIPFEDRIRYGLPIENDKRKELLKQFIMTKDNH